MIPTGVLVLVWISIYQDHSDIRGYTLSNILLYYLLVMIISGLTSSHFEQWRVEEIRLGKIDLFLTRPFSYLIDIFIVHFAGKVFFTIISLPAYFFVTWLILSTLNIPLTFSLNLMTSIQLGLLFIFTFLIEFLIALLIVILGFWFEGSEGLEHFKWISITLFSGSMIPLAMMPTWLQTVSGWLPFKYMYAVPISLLQAKAHLTLNDGVNMSLFVAILGAITYFIWQKAKYKYTSAGG